jgi:hypothetical protein
MKKFTLFILLSLFLFAGVTFAQNADKKWAIGLGPGAYYNLELEEAGFLGEIYFSRYLSPSFDLMLKSEFGFNDDGNDLANPLLNLRYKFSNGKIFSETSAIQPYLYAGPGYLLDNGDNGINLTPESAPNFR